MTRRTVHVLGVPFNSAGRTDGVARGPAALRRAGLIERLRTTGLDIVDRGDVGLAATAPERDPATLLIAPGPLAAMIRAVRADVAAIVGDDAFPLVLGGDCPILLGCLGGSAVERMPGLLFVDGHEDAWPTASSSTGEAADMELGFALGITLDGLPPDLKREIPRLEARSVVVIGPRDHGELADAGVASVRDRVELVSAASVASDPEAVFAAAAAHLERDPAWWIHVDLDVLSTASLGAVDYRQAGGIDWDALTRLTRLMLSSPRAIGWDVTIYNPDLDRDGSAAARIVRYLAESLDAA